MYITAIAKSETCDLVLEVIPCHLVENNLQLINLENQTSIPLIYKFSISFSKGSRKGIKFMRWLMRRGSW